MNKNKEHFVPKDIELSLYTYFTSICEYKDFTDKQIKHLIDKTLDFYLIVLHKYTYFKYVHDTGNSSGYEIDVSQLDKEGNFKWVYITQDSFKKLSCKIKVGGKISRITNKTFYVALATLGFIQYKIDRYNLKCNGYSISNVYDLETSDWSILETNKKIPKFDSSSIIKRSRTFEYSYISQISTFNRVKISTQISDVLVQLQSQKYSETQISYLMNSLLRINNKDFYATVDVTGRFHTTFSGLPSKVYQYLTINNKKLVEVDVTNCQFLLFSLLWADGSDGATKYRKSVESGNFYEDLIETAKIVYKDNTIDREFCKKNISMSVLFREIKSKSNNKPSTVLDTVFPGIIEFLDANYRYDDSSSVASLKTDMKKMQNFKKKRENYLETKFLWVALQNLESELILKKMSELKVPYLTKHDAVIVQEGNENLVQELIKKSFFEKGLKVNLKTKKF